MPNLVDESTAQVQDESEPLFILLQRLNAVDQSFQDIGLDDEIDLLNKGKIKIDAYKFILDKLAAQLWYLDQRLDEYQKAKKTVNNAQSRVKSRLLEALEANEFTKFTGNQWIVSVRKASPSVEISGTGEIDVSLKIKHPDLIKTTYTPDKTAIKKALQAGEELGWASLKEANYIAFTINKEGK
jgi:hypothetical protein